MVQYVIILHQIEALVVSHPSYNHSSRSQTTEFLTLHSSSASDYLIASRPSNSLNTPASTASKFIHSPSQSSNIFNWPFRQMDVKNAFLHGVLQDEVYLEQPLGFHSSTHHSNYVCKLHKSLYGLQQATRAWNDRFTSFLPGLGFKASQIDPSLFVQHSSKGIVILLLYVDDVILTGSSSELVTHPDQYRNIVGALQYLTFTIPDITLSVNQACQFMHNPMESHVLAIKMIIRYLKGTSNLGIQFRPRPIHLQSYSDADSDGDPNDRRSTSGFIIYLSSNPISWALNKQHTVLRSSIEAEYRALAITAA
ncbi:unnamed protein product [Malus baccata var. baccata]